MPLLFSKCRKSVSFMWYILLWTRTPGIRWNALPHDITETVGISMVFIPLQQLWSKMDQFWVVLASIAFSTRQSFLFLPLLLSSLPKEQLYFCVSPWEGRQLAAIKVTLWPGRWEARESHLLASAAEIECHLCSSPVYRKMIELFLTKRIVCQRKGHTYFQAVRKEEDVTNACILRCIF